MRNCKCAYFIYSHKREATHCLVLIFTLSWFSYKRPWLKWLIENDLYLWCVGWCHNPSSLSYSQNRLCLKLHIWKCTFMNIITFHLGWNNVKSGTARYVLINSCIPNTTVFSDLTLLSEGKKITLTSEVWMRSWYSQEEISQKHFEYKTKMTSCWFEEPKLLWNTETFVSTFSDPSLTDPKQGSVHMCMLCNSPRTWWKQWLVSSTHLVDLCFITVQNYKNIWD